MRYIFGLILILSFLNSKAQTPALTEVKNSITALADNYPQEKIYLHFDKASYTPGESVWFKAYIVTGLQPSYISKTVYVDFINAEGRVIKHCVQPVYQATANGDFDIPTGYNNEVLFVKA